MTPTVPTADTIVAFIEEIFERRGADSYLGESVTMSQHMLQAAYLAEQENANKEVVTAALLHDIGHYTNEFPDDALEHGVNNYHDHAGAAVLQHYFPPIVTDCIRYHVDAKRYLCAIETAYFDALSDASKHSLSLQGGPMRFPETQSFSKLEHVDAIVQVRRWDDRAKDPSVTTPPFSHYRTTLEAVCLTGGK